MKRVHVFEYVISNMNLKEIDMKLFRKARNKCEIVISLIFF